MIKPHGYVTVVGDGIFQEHDTITCGHCNQIVMTKPGSFSTTYYIPQLVGPHKEEPGAMCRVCMRAICLECHDNGHCLPLERKIEQMEARGRLLQSMGIG